MGASGEMVDTLALGASALGHGGSSPLSRTKYSYARNLLNLLYNVAKEPHHGTIDATI